MNRLIDTLCRPHRTLILEARMWPAGPAVAECPDCSYAGADIEFLPGMDERQELAIHEAGHAFSLVRDGLHVEYATLAVNDRFAAHTNFVADDPGSLDTLTGLWAGYMATRTWLSRLGRLDAAAEVDVAQGARSDAAFIYSATLDTGLIDEARLRAEWVVDRHFARIERVADELLTAGKLTGDQVDAAAWG